MSSPTRSVITYATSTSLRNKKTPLVLITVFRRIDHAVGAYDAYVVPGEFIPAPYKPTTDKVDTTKVSPATADPSTVPRGSRMRHGRSYSTPIG
jgi:hypothetical protein